MATLIHSSHSLFVNAEARDVQSIRLEVTRWQNYCSANWNNRRRPMQTTNAPGSKAPKSFDEASAMFLALESGQVDAILQDFPINASTAQ